MASNPKDVSVDLKPDPLLDQFESSGATSAITVSGRIGEVDRDHFAFCVTESLDTVIQIRRTDVLRVEHHEGSTSPTRLYLRGDAVVTKTIELSAATFASSGSDCDCRVESASGLSSNFKADLCQEDLRTRLAYCPNKEPFSTECANRAFQAYNTCRDSFNQRVHESVAS